MRLTCSDAVITVTKVPAGPTKSSSWLGQEHSAHCTVSTTQYMEARPGSVIVYHLQDKKVALLHCPPDSGCMCPFNFHQWRVVLVSNVASRHRPWQGDAAVAAAAGSSTIAGSCAASGNSSSGSGISSCHYPCHTLRHHAVVLLTVCYKSMTCSIPIRFQSWDPAAAAAAAVTTWSVINYTAVATCCLPSSVIANDQLRLPAAEVLAAGCAWPARRLTVTE